MARRPRAPAGFAAAPPRRGDRWLFAYGALMGGRGFDFAEARPALLRGYHRSFCIYSHVYRGTPERPGLVLGLDLGGMCRGVAFRLPAAGARDTLARIMAREMVTNVYVPRRLGVLLLDPETGRPSGRVTAQAFVARRTHPQYAGRLRPERAAELILAAAGEKGPCREYFERVFADMRALGIRDRPLERLAALLARGGPG